MSYSVFLFLSSTLLEGRSCIWIIYLHLVFCQDTFSRLSDSICRIKWKINIYFHLKYDNILNLTIFLSYLLELEFSLRDIQNYYNFFSLEFLQTLGNHKLSLTEFSPQTKSVSSVPSWLTLDLFLLFLMLFFFCFLKLLLVLLFGQFPSKTSSTAGDYFLSSSATLIC